MVGHREIDVGLAGCAQRAATYGPPRSSGVARTVPPVGTPADRLTGGLITILLAGLLAGLLGGAGSASAAKPKQPIGSASGASSEESPAEAQTTADRAIRPKNGVVRVVGRGWGHGRGMSQWGAAVAGELGVDYREILSFYYPNTELSESTATGPLRVRLSHDGGPARVRPEPGLLLRWTDASGKARRRALPTVLADCPVRSWRVTAVGESPELEGYYCGRWHTYLPAADGPGGLLFR